MAVVWILAKFKITIDQKLVCRGGGVVDLRDGNGAVGYLEDDLSPIIILIGVETLHHRAHLQFHTEVGS